MAANSINAKLQFSLAQAMAGTTVIAVLLAALRQGPFFAVVTGVALGESALILVATLAYLKSPFPRSLPQLLLRGSLCTATLCAICFGWVPLLMVIDTGELFFLIPFGVIVLIGGAVGFFIATCLYLWRLRQGQRT